MSELMKSREDHAKLARLFRRLGDMIELPEAPSQLELFEARSTLLSTLLAHLKFEDWALYPRLIRSDDPQLASTGRAFKEEMSGLAPAFLVYSEKWTAHSIGSDWEGYRNETRGMLKALGNRLTRENRELLPLLERLQLAP